MYKIQLTFQKIACYLAVVCGAVNFLYSLGMLTDLYDSLYSTMRNPKNLSQTTVPGSIVYYDMQDFNKLLMYAGIALLLLAGLLFLTQTHARRRYYVGNLTATGLFSVAALGVTAWAHGEISAFKTQYLTTVDFEKLALHAKMMKSYYTESTFWFDVHYAVAALTVLTVLALIVNAVWKLMLMQAEKRLLEKGKAAMAA